MNKFVSPSPFADPEVAARKIVEIANAVEPVQDGRIHVEKINGPFLFQLKGTPAEYKAGLDLAIRQGLAGDARERHFRKVHTGRRRSVRLTTRDGDDRTDRRPTRGLIGPVAFSTCLRLLPTFLTAFFTAGLDLPVFFAT